MALIEESKLITVGGASTLYNDLRDRIKITDSNVSTLNTDLANKLDSANVKSKGSATQPVYFDTNGVATPISYTIEANVPSGAKFTDTTYTAGPGLLLQGSEFVVDTTVVSTIVNTNKSLEAKADKTYVDEELAKLTSALIYRGSVDNYSDLPSNASIGDVYNVKNAYKDIPEGTNYAWTGAETGWDALGGTVTVDLSGYVQGSIASTTDIENMMNSVKNPT